MSTNFSFIGNNFENILKDSGIMLPGIEKIVAIYFNEELGNPIAKYVLREEPNELFNLSIKDDYHEIQNLRSETLNYNWYKKGELPFETENLSSEINILNEVENVVLLLRFKNEFDEKYDLLYVFFNSNMSNFGVSRSNKDLTTENKAIIGFLLYNNFNSIIITNKKNKSILKSMNENTRSLIRQSSILKNELSQTRTNYGESLVNLSIQYLKDLSENLNKSYKFAKDALEKISRFKGNINNLKLIIEKSITYINNISFDTNEFEIIIHDSHINFYDYEVESKIEKTDNNSEEIYAKTVLLLNKYERAAKKVLSNGDSMTSINVGTACPVPITAPAISDSLKKHKDQINYLFDKYPDKWEVIRRGFRPVKNLFLGWKEKKDKIA